jgi:hypothetical protein
MNNPPQAEPNTSLPDEALLDQVQQRTIAFFWDMAHPVCGMTPDRVNADNPTSNDLIATGGSGFGIMALIVGVERGWVDRVALLDRLLRVTDFLLNTAESHHGLFPHFLNGVTGKAQSWGGGDAGNDIVETAFLMVGLLTARQYFTGDGKEAQLRERINTLWRRAEWNWHAAPDRATIEAADQTRALIWHWSPEHDWGTNHQIRGWDECLIAYVLGASSPTHPIPPEAYHQGWAVNRTFQNGKSYYGLTLPLGPEYGGPLFFAHFSFLGLDPRGLKDRYADYWQQNRTHVHINYEYCVENPKGHKGYGPDCWGLTASDGDKGYSAYQPIWDQGVIAPTAALASMPYAPAEALRALRCFHGMGEKLWGQYGFVDAFNAGANWYANDYLAIDQGPIAVMIENYRTGLLWRLFMSCPEMDEGLRTLGFESWRTSAVV